MFWKKIFNTRAETITGAAIILAAASGASRLLGFARDRALAHYFGANNVIDAYYAAFKIPDLTYNLIILGAFSAGFIPVFSKLLNKKSSPDVILETRFRKSEPSTRMTSEDGNGNKKAWSLVNNAVNSLGLFLALLTLILIFCAPLLVPLIAPGFAGEKLALTVKMTRVMLLSPLLLGLSTVVGAVLQSFKNFLVYSLSPLFYNLGIIIGVVFFVPLWGNIGLAWGVILGAIFHLLVQLPSLFHAGYHYGWHFNLRDKNLITVIKLIIPRTLGLAAGQINSAVMTMLASTLAAGSVAIYNYANNLQSLPLGLIGASFAIAAFPTLSALASENNKRDMIKIFSSTTRQILFFIIPLTIIFLMLRAQIVRVVLGTGAFNWEATVRTADTLAFFVLSLFAQTLVLLLARTFYALENTKTPFWCSIFSVIVNIAAGWFLTRRFLGVEGLALAYSLGMLVNLAFLWILLRIKLGDLEENQILPAVYKMSVAGILMGLSIQGMKTVADSFLNTHTFIGIASQGLIAGSVGLITYAAAGFLLKSHEMIVFGQTIKKKFVRKDSLPEDISESLQLPK